MRLQGDGNEGQERWTDWYSETVRIQGEGNEGRDEEERMRVMIDGLTGTEGDV